MRCTSFIRTASSQERSILGTKVPLIALRQILAVSRYGSFRHAAQALGVSQSSISARVKSLEEEIGIVLIDRNTRGMSAALLSIGFARAVIESRIDGEIWTDQSDCSH
ncbi:LysR family transcriptional regulator [Rhodopseudomonas palustris]|nr:LysR family transcriptional regulator [Rhodopseudomonas palustris]